MQSAPIPGGARGRRVAVLFFGLLVALAVGFPVLLFAGKLGNPDARAPFDASASCAGADKQMNPGAYPDLEARIPTQIDGVAPVNRDSGRFCSKKTLGSIFDAGITEVRFGGAQWLYEDGAGIQLSAFSAPGLTAKLQADEYRRAAGAVSGIQTVAATQVTVAGRTGYRLEVIRNDSRQVIVVWPSADGAVVQVVTGVDVPDPRLQAALDAFG